jgi:hypothetical protein
MNSSPASAEAWDWRTVLLIPLGQFAPWLASVLLVTWAGYPGVVCVTPVAWLMALRVGLVCARSSSSPKSSRRVQEAALAGVFFGLLQGILFLVILPLMGEVKPAEWTGALVLIAFMLVGGMLAGAGLAAFTASQLERRLC